LFREVLQFRESVSAGRAEARAASKSDAAQLSDAMVSGILRGIMGSSCG
jgi:hypothetical protein